MRWAVTSLLVAVTATSGAADQEAPTPSAAGKPVRPSAAGDPHRAVDARLEAAERKPLPDDRARMYGMWFIDYRPYLELAAGHVALGNWRCAFSALKLSRATGEVDDDDGPAMRYLELLEETLAHVGAGSE